MSHTSEQLPKVVPARLGFLAIYNPSLGTTDDTLENQIVYYSQAEPRGDQNRVPGNANSRATEDAIRQQNNERLRQIGLAQGMVEFARGFSDGRSVDTIETEKSRIILHELEAGWWILASINLTIVSSTAKKPAVKGKSTEEKETIEYSSREVKPPILLLGDLLQAHSTFLLHHASSMSALFVRTRRSKFVGILSRYWDTFLSTWNVLMHGNPANNLYGGIKIAACGELGVGVGEEERGSGERDVLEGFVGRIDGLVDVIVSKFGEGGSGNEAEKEGGKKAQDQRKPTEPWLGSGDEPAAEDGIIFLGNGALSRKSLRDVSHWVEDLYRWGPHAYGVVDNPSSNRRTKKSRSRTQSRKKELSPEAKLNSRRVYGLSPRDGAPKEKSILRQSSMKTIQPKPIDDEGDGDVHDKKKSQHRRPSFHRGSSGLSHTSTDSESSKTNKFAQYFKFGYGTHWSLGGSSARIESYGEEEAAIQTPSSPAGDVPGKDIDGNDGQTEVPVSPHDDSVGHYLIGLMGNIEDVEKEEDSANENPESFMSSGESYNARLVLRTLTVELEREEDARAEADISIDLGNMDYDQVSSKIAGSEHTGTSNASFESQDRNKTKKLRVVVYAIKPFIFIFLFELRTDALALTSLYRSLHYQIGPLHKPLLASTSYRASKPYFTTKGSENAKTPIYDLVWDPKLLTINSTIPNVPDPFQSHSKSAESLAWSRIEALNTHMQIINTYLASAADRVELERTCKTSRGWWVVWTRVPDVEPSIVSTASFKVEPSGLIAEDRTDLATSRNLVPGRGTSRGTSHGTSHGTSRGTSSFVASLNSAAHPFLETPSNGNEWAKKDKEIFLIRRASDYVPTKSSGRFASGSFTGGDTGPGKLADGIGVDTRRYIEGLLNLHQ